MTTLVVTLTDICSGGNHLTFGVTGAKEMTLPGVLGEMLEPITDEEAHAFVKIICKMAKGGRTLVQARNLLQAGVTITV